jgi:hypothetical protein
MEARSWGADHLREEEIETSEGGMNALGGLEVFGVGGEGRGEVGGVMCVGVKVDELGRMGCRLRKMMEAEVG